MSEPLDLIAAALRDHGSPIPDNGYPGDEYDCCAAYVQSELAKQGYKIDAVQNGKLTDCDGSFGCESLVHMHGCFSDDGNCDNPGDHICDCGTCRAIEVDRERRHAAGVRELTPRVLEGDWETVRDALDALPEGAQIRWRTGISEHIALALRTARGWEMTGIAWPLDSDNIARDETPIEVIA